MTEIQLFSRSSLLGVIQDREKKIVAEINGYTEEEISEGIEKLCDNIYNKYKFVPPSLLVDEMNMLGKYEREVRTDNLRNIRRVSYCEIEIPFTGERELFLYTPSSFIIKSIPAELVSNAIRLKYLIDDRKAEQIRAEIDGDVKDINILLTNVTSDVNKFNSKIREISIRELQKRRDKFEKEQDVLKNIGIPLKRK